MKSLRPLCREPVGITFAVSPVAQALRPLPEKPRLEAIGAYLGGPVESCSGYMGQLVDPCAGAGLGPDGAHPLIRALHDAYTSHRPICLSPDVIWLTLTQGLAQHVHANAEAIRRRFVRHAGQFHLVVRRDDFHKGAAENPWPEAFAALSTAVREHMGDARDLIVADFSTTGPVERAASEVVLLDCVQPYFAYEVHTLCGIPSITLEGTVEDWEAIVRRVRAWEAFDLGWWLGPLLPVLEQFVEAAAGRIDRAFWESIYKWEGPRGSGSAHVSGWVSTLFPYLHSRQAIVAAWCGQASESAALVRNPWLGRPLRRRGPGRDEFPAAPARVPFRWQRLEQSFDMEFIAGLLGVRQDPDTLCLRPEIGWAIGARPVVLQAAPTPAAGKLDLVQPGMTLAQVKELLGDGETQSRGEHTERVAGVWVRTTTAVVVWRHEGQAIVVTFENDRVVRTQ